MPQIRNGELADSEVPVRMSGPLHIEIITPIERELHVLALQLVHNRPVVDSPDGNSTSVSFVIELRPLLLDGLDVNRFYAEHLLSEQKIREGFLLQGMNLHQDYV